jgi:hypothetical protein
VDKEPDKWILVQDLRFVNETVVPLYPVVPNLFTILAQIPPNTTHYSVLNLKVAFFCVPLYPDCQPLFAFEDQKSLRDFGTAPMFLACLYLRIWWNGIIHRPFYCSNVGDLLLHGPSKPNVSQATESLKLSGRMRLLGVQGKVSVMPDYSSYVGLVLARGMRALGGDRIQPI